MSDMVMNIVFIGSGGCMRELAWQIMESDPEHKKWDIIGYVDIERPISGPGINVGKKDISYLGDDSYFDRIQQPVDVIVSIGSSRERKSIVERLKKNPLLRFPNIVLDNAYVCKDTNMWQESEGCIISMDCKVSTNVKMGNFVFMNTGSMICHDGIVGDFVTLGPDVKLAGAVKIGKDTDIGMGAKVIPGIFIGSCVVIGAGSIVIRDVGDRCRIAGVPAREI